MGSNLSKPQEILTPSKDLWMPPNPSSGDSAASELTHPTVFTVEHPLPTVVEPADETLQKMDLILTKRLQGVSLEQFYHLIWQSPQFYQAWLQANPDSIQVGNWQAAEGGCDSPFAFPSQWKDDKTRYGRKRSVSLMPAGAVAETHWIRRTDQSCIVQIQGEDTTILEHDYNVQIRWVVTPLAADQQGLKIQVGLCVQFLDGQQEPVEARMNRSETTKQITQTQTSLLQAVAHECKKHAEGGYSGLVVLVDEEEPEESDPEEDEDAAGHPCFALPLVRFCIPTRKRPSSPPLDKKAQPIQGQLQQVVEFQAEEGDPQTPAVVEENPQGDDDGGNLFTGVEDGSNAGGGEEEKEEKEKDCNLRLSIQDALNSLHEESRREPSSAENQIDDASDDESVAPARELSFEGKPSKANASTSSNKVGRILLGTPKKALGRIRKGIFGSKSKKNAAVTRK